MLQCYQCNTFVPFNFFQFFKSKDRLWRNIQYLQKFSDYTLYFTENSPPSLINFTFLYYIVLHCIVLFVLSSTNIFIYMWKNDNDWMLEWMNGDSYLLTWIQFSFVQPFPRLRLRPHCHHSQQQPYFIITSRFQFCLSQLFEFELRMYRRHYLNCAGGLQVQWPSCQHSPTIDQFLDDLQ